MLADGSQHWSSLVRCAQPANQPRETSCPSAHGSHPSCLVLLAGRPVIRGKAHARGSAFGHGVCVWRRWTRKRWAAGRGTIGHSRPPSVAEFSALLDTALAPGCVAINHCVLASQSVFGPPKKSVFSSFCFRVFKPAGRPTLWDLSGSWLRHTDHQQHRAT